MGAAFIQLLEVILHSFIPQTKPDTFYKELHRDQIRYLRRNNIKIHRMEQEQELEEVDEDVSEEE